MAVGRIVFQPQKAQYRSLDQPSGSGETLTSHGNALLGKFTNKKRCLGGKFGCTTYRQTQGQTQELEPDQLLRQADQAMYQAKQAGKNRFHVFDPEQNRSVRERHESLQGIERALNEGETAQHGFMLPQLGCELAQGYGIAHPMPADELPRWVKSWKPDPS